MLWACEAKREIAIPEADLESVKHFKKLVDVTSVHNRLLVYSFGSPPLSSVGARRDPPSQDSGGRSASGRSSTTPSSMPASCG